MFRILFIEIRVGACAFLAPSETATAICVPDPENVHEELREYDWESSKRSVRYYPLGTVLLPDQTLGGVIYSYSMEADGYVAVGHTDALPARLAIPAEIGGYPVKGIGDKAFRECNNLTSVTIPEGVTSVGESAFYMCTALEDVYFDGTQEQWDAVEIGGSNDPLLTAEIHFAAAAPHRVVVSDVGTDAGETIWTLYDDGELVIEGTGVFALPSGSFMNYELDGGVSLLHLIRSVVVCEGITGLEASFNECHDIRSFSFPASLNSIGERVFGSCLTATVFTVAEGNTSFRVIDGALYQIDPMELILYPRMNGEESFSIPAGVTGIRAFAFEYNQSLRHLTIPDSVTSIGCGAFAYTKLEELALPEGITNLDGTACSLSGIRRLILPASMEYFPFSDMYALECVEVAKGNPRFTSRDGVLYSKDMSTLLYCPSGKTGCLVIPEKHDGRTGGRFCILPESGESRDRRRLHGFSRFGRRDLHERRQHADPIPEG